MNSRTQTVRLGSLELVKIGDYQDYIWNDGGTWKKHKVFGKQTFDASVDEQWLKSGQTTTTIFVATLNNMLTGDFIHTQYMTRSLCDHFTFSETRQIGTWRFVDFSGANNQAKYIHFRFDIADIPDATAFTTWLANNPTTVYFYETTTTDETITDADLIADLDALYNTKTYDGQTNIGVASVSPNLPGILTVDAFKNNLAGTLAGYNEQIARLEARVADLEN